MDKHSDVTKMSVVIISLSKYRQRFNKTGKPPVCYSCPTELKVGDEILTRPSSGARSKMVKWRCMDCARRLNLL